MHFSVINNEKQQRKLKGGQILATGLFSLAAKALIQRQAK